MHQLLMKKQESELTHKPRKILSGSLHCHPLLHQLWEPATPKTAIQTRAVISNPVIYAI